ncbi:hypothetical protein B0H21DRAFT_710892 [Amylocystis lapponica]|nr:hypothetical protein B0H21DRAFT_710892 [Amylocystis lapponica]
MSESYKIPIFPESQQLGLTNWQNWKAKILAIVRVRKLYGHFTGTLVRPSDPSPGEVDPVQILATTTAQQKWDDNDELAITIIITNIIDLASSGLNTDEGRTAYQIWSQLVGLREKRDQLTVMNAEDYLKACKWQPGTDLHTHVAELRRRFRVARDIGSALTDERFAVIICNSMPPSMESVTMPLLTQPDPERVIEIITAVYENRRIQSGQPSDPLGGRSDYGAVIPQTSAYMTRAKADMICDWCWWKGHMKGDCFCEGGGKAGRQPSTWRSQPQPKKGSPADCAREARMSNAGGNPATTANVAQAFLASDYGMDDAHTPTFHASDTSYDYSIFMASLTSVGGGPKVDQQSRFSGIPDAW